MRIFPTAIITSIMMHRALVTCIERKNEIAHLQLKGGFSGPVATESEIGLLFLLGR